MVWCLGLRPVPWEQLADSTGTIHMGSWLDINACPLQVATSVGQVHNHGHLSHQTSSCHCNIKHALFILIKRLVDTKNKYCLMESVILFNVARSLDYSITAFFQPCDCCQCIHQLAHVVF